MDLEEKTSKFPPSIQASLEKIEGSIFPGRVAYPYPFYHIIPNATVKLIYEGVVLDEVKATVRGSFSFEEQAIPLDKTFIYVEAPDYYPTIRKID